MMHSYSDFQSILQLAVGVYLVVEWADLSSIKTWYTERTKNRMLRRIMRVQQYVEGLKDMNIMSPEADFLFKSKPDSSLLSLAEKIFKVSARFILLYSLILLLITSFVPKAIISTCWAVSFIIPIFTPVLFFLFIFPYLFKKASQSNERIIVELISNAEKSANEFDEKYTDPMINLISKKFKYSSSKEYIDSRRKYEEEKEIYIKRRLAELEKGDSRDA